MEEKVISLGQHFIVELYGCSPKSISDSVSVQSVLLKSAEIAKANIVLYDFQQLKNQGVSGAIVISESHFSVHTWPQKGYASLDIFTCGETMNEEAAINHIKESFQSQKMELGRLERGLLPDSEKEGLSYKANRAYDHSINIPRKGIHNYHYIIELYKCEHELIATEKTVAPALLEAAQIAEPKVFADKEIIVNKFHNFEPSGSSGVILAPRAHITAHTWPEHDYAAVDLFLPRESQEIISATDRLREWLKAKRVDVSELKRGNPDYFSTNY